MGKVRKRLGRILVALKIIDEEQLNEALAFQKENGCKIGEALIELQYSTQVQITQALARQFKLPYVDLSKGEINQDIISLVSKEVVEDHNIIPIKKTKKSLIVAMTDPLDILTLDNLKFILGTEVDCALTTPDSMAAAITQYYGVDQSVMDEIHTAITETDIYSSDASIEEEEIQEEEEEEAPVIRLVTLIINEALKNRASDIHIEPMASKLRVRYRVDGVCFEVDSPPKRLQGPILSRIKIMSDMDISEKRAPQDGRIKINLQGRSIDLRVSSLPCNHGESIVMRILDKEKAIVSLETLGLHETDYDRFQRNIKKPNGIFLVTGPTGSGKTTTLYAALTELNRSDVKIITAENPVEYNVAGINQCQVRHDIGLNFARILRAMLRQAPNVVLVGEIRDQETAEIAIQAALTGHLVFSTLHTNDAPGALTRLIDMGVKPFLVSSAVQAIMAQRLVRRLCEKCKEMYEPDMSELTDIGLTPEDIKEARIYKPIGCQECKQSGYKGRMGIYELLEMSQPLRELTFQQASTMKLREEAKLTGGMSVLQKDGIKKVLSGLTSIEEILRVTHAK